MTTLGARNATRDQMVRVLHLPAEESKLLASGDVGRFYAHPRRDFELSVANAIWGQSGYPWRPEFLAVQKDRFGAGLQQADFIKDPEAERLKINAWAEAETRGKIKDLIAERMITTLTRMVLANAIYFKGTWEKQFDPKETRPMPFTMADGKQTPVPMMHREGNFRLFTQPGKDGAWQPEFQVAELPYRGGELSMVVLLPGKPDGLPALEAKLTPDTLATWLKEAKEAKDLDLYLPKFKIETESMMLKDSLQKLGMVDAFDPARADFGGLHTGGEQLFVSFVVQKAFVDVNEKGTEAAAATAVGIQAVAAKPEFRADRPFLFLIRDTKRGTILFLGRFAKP
jgi:serpin B